MRTAETVYLAGKLAGGETTVEQFAGELERRGHQILAPWWRLGVLPKPYLDPNHIRGSGEAAKTMLDAASGCSVFVLFPDPHILGAAIEFGAALASKELSLPEKHIIVVNPFDASTRQSVFYAHPLVTAVRGLQQIRQMAWY